MSPDETLQRQNATKRCSLPLKKCGNHTTIATV